MLHSPVENVLAPLAPNEAELSRTSPFTMEASADVPQDLTDLSKWCDLGEVSARFDETALPLMSCLKAIQSAPLAGGYEVGFAEFTTGDFDQAASAFLLSALTGGPIAASLFGAATALSSLEQHSQAMELAAFLSSCRDYTDPRPPALAGYSAFKLQKTKDARVFLSKASRLASKNSDFRAVQKFTQRVLLIQQFGNGNL